MKTPKAATYAKRCMRGCGGISVWADGKHIRTLESLMGPDGELKSVQVHRSRDSEASAAALAAVRRVQELFPPAAHLMRRHAKTFDFSETFLFNEQYRFQLRTLSGPQ